MPGHKRKATCTKQDEVIERKRKSVENQVSYNFFFFFIITLELRSSWGNFFHPWLCVCVCVCVRAECLFNSHFIYIFCFDFQNIELLASNTRRDFPPPNPEIVQAQAPSAPTPRQVQVTYILALRRLGG